MYVHVLIIIMLFALDNFAAIVTTVNMCLPPYFYWGHLTPVTFDAEFRWSIHTQMVLQLVRTEQFSLKINQIR